jgi:hypothetical protein
MPESQPIPRRPNYIRKLAKEIPPPHETQKLLRSIDSIESPSVDYAVAMIGASLIDKALEVGILSKCRPLNDGERQSIFSADNGGPLSDFAARIKMAYALNLFGPHTYEDLQSIRRIRNLFAHNPSLHSFTGTEIQQECSNLYIFKILTVIESGDFTNPRSRYASASVAIARRVRADMTFTLAALLSGAPKSFNPFALP